MMFSTVQTACATPPSYRDGGVAHTHTHTHTHRAYEQFLPMLILAHNFICILYFNIYSEIIMCVCVCVCVCIYIYIYWGMLE